MTKEEILLLGQNEILLTSLIRLLINKNIITSEEILTEIKSNNVKNEILETINKLLNI